MEELGIGHQSLRDENDRLRAALEMIYDKWEDGIPCFEDLENHDGPLGNAFKLSYEEENEILSLIGPCRKGK